MNKIWISISILLIMSLMGFASALAGSGVDYGTSEPWVGGNPPPRLYLIQFILNIIPFTMDLQLRNTLKHHDNMR